MEIRTQKKGDRVRSICSYCKRPLNDIASEDAEYTIEGHDDSVSHGICPDCLLHHFPNEYLAIQEGKKIRIRKVFKKQFTGSTDISDCSCKR
jgi:hypothetical protein